MKSKWLFAVLTVIVLITTCATSSSAKLERKRDGNGFWQLFDGAKQITFIKPYTQFVEETEKERLSSFGVTDLKISGSKNALFVFRESGSPSWDDQISVYYLNYTTGKYSKIIGVNVVGRAPFFLSSGAITFSASTKAEIRGADHAVVFDSKYEIYLIMANADQRAKTSNSDSFSRAYAYARKSVREKDYDCIVYIRNTDTVDENDGWDYIVGTKYVTSTALLINTATARIVSSATINSDGVVGGTRLNN
ncbi:MAG TPA: hypothetical protein P5096_03115 [Patescibacteria group bacterium]|nr:hypothetical protein [Patescibacteria group bacterium]